MINRYFPVLSFMKMNEAFMNGIRTENNKNGLVGLTKAQQT